jgi:hypothetical protein
MKNEQTKKPMTEVEALTRITKVLNQLNESQRKRVLAFLAGGE